MQQDRDGWQAGAMPGGGRREPPTIDITPDGYRVHGGDRSGPGADRMAPGGGRSLLAAIASLAVVGLVLLGAFALGVLTFLIAIPVAVGAIVAALIAGFFMRRRMRNGGGMPPAGGSGPGAAWQRPGR